VDKNKELTDEGEQQGDLFYHGIVSKIFWSSESGVILSESGKEFSFVFPFVKLIGVPRQDVRFLREGMRVGFDVGRTPKGLRVSIIKVYDLYS
jgi:cold shock CspA family protein